MDFPCLLPIEWPKGGKPEDLSYILESIAEKYLSSEPASILEAWSIGLQLHNRITRGEFRPGTQRPLRSKNLFVCAGSCHQLFRTERDGLSFCQQGRCSSNPATNKVGNPRAIATSRIRGAVTKAVRGEMRSLGIKAPHTREQAQLMASWADTLVGRHWDDEESALRDSLTSLVLGRQPNKSSSQGKFTAQTSPTQRAHQHYRLPSSLKLIS